jgi:DNA repair protein RadD
MIIEREYQKKAADFGTKSLLTKTKNEMIVAPTGSGKSIIIGGICHRLDQPTLILQPTKEILEQNYAKALAYGMDDVAMYSASVNKKDVAKYTYATIGSIYKIPEVFRHFKKIIIDECHVVDPRSFGKKNKKAMYARFFEDLGNPRVLGLTASPYRLVNHLYTDPDTNDQYYTGHLQVLNRIPPFFFKSFAFNITNQRLFDEGWLCPIEYQVSHDDEVDVDRWMLNSTGSDFDESKLEEFMVNHENIVRVANIIMENRGRIKHNLVFCTSLRHARTLAEFLAKAGLSVDIISSYDDKRERERKIADFRAGRIVHLLNVGVLTVGFDFPALDCITLARPTFSLALYYQMVGRGIRIDPLNPQKVCLVLDVTNNVLRMGRIETIRVGTEPGGYKNVVETEVGIITGKPLFRFLIKNKELKAKINSSAA